MTKCIPTSDKTKGGKIVLWQQDIIHFHFTNLSGDSVTPSVHSARVVLNFLPLGGLFKLPVLTPGQELFFIVDIQYTMTSSYF